MSSYIPFVDVLCDNTRLATKIEKTEYLETGDYIIIDQGKKDVAGYNNNAQGLYKDVPAIIFGDHTRIIKYVDKPCYIGADGVKLLGLTTKSKNSFDYKFLYYFLANQNIPDTGYNRHFKWLKDVNILNIPLSSQKEIVEVLDMASELVEKRKEQLRELDNLAESVFYDMFGDPVTNSKGWKNSTIGQFCHVGTGGTPDRQQTEKYYNGHIPWVKTTEVQNSVVLSTEEKITDIALKNSNCKVYPLNTILLAMYGQGKTRGQIAKLGISAATNQACAAIIPDKSVNVDYLYSYLLFSYNEIRSLGRGGNQENLNLSLVKSININLPSIELQNQFASIIEKIEVQKAKVKEALKESEDLFQRLMQDVFNPQHHEK